MIKNMLTRRRESDTYLTTVNGHRWSRQITMKIDVAFSQHCGLYQLKRKTDSNVSRYCYGGKLEARVGKAE